MNALIGKLTDLYKKTVAWYNDMVYEANVDLFQKGKDYGYNEGKIDGYIEGRSEGFELGKNAGYAEGYAEGYARYKEAVETGVSIMTC